jgi:hypothetical protein
MITDELINIKKIIKEYNFNFSDNDKHEPDSMGIGDLLINILHLQHNLFHSPIKLNVKAFTSSSSNVWYTNPINALKFRLQLLDDILKNHKFLEKNDVIFFYNDNENYNQDFMWKNLKNFKLNSEMNLNDKICDEKYIVFHTKLRLRNNFDYNMIKNQILNFSKNFRTDYTICLLGEQYFPQTSEKKWHGITTIYEELNSLKMNNNVLDLTIPEIYNSLDYDLYKKDISIIKNAEYNVVIGCGGQLCSSMIFGEKTYFFLPNEIMFENDYLKNNNIYHYDNIVKLFDDIKK